MVGIYNDNQYDCQIPGTGKKAFRRVQSYLAYLTDSRSRPKDVENTKRVIAHAVPHEPCHNMQCSQQEKQMKALEILVNLYACNCF